MPGSQGKQLERRWAGPLGRRGCAAGLRRGLTPQAAPAQERSLAHLPPPPVGQHPHLTHHRDRTLQAVAGALAEPGHLERLGR